jgi:tRNA dimethylallyltransferase
MMSSSDASVVEAALRVARSHPDDLLVIVGPTASGKTALAVTLAERLGGDVVSADSVQIYRHFDIGSGKPTREQLAMAPHHLVGEIDPMDAIDAVSWADRAARAIGDVRARGRVPIVCGGTFLWVKALVYGLADMPAASAQVRAVHRDIAALEGRAALHARLRQADPESAARLHPNDFVRVSRALEVCELTGKPMSFWQREHQFKSQRRGARLLSLACDAATLTARIEARVSTWLARGWIDEVESLLARGFGSARAMGSVGYVQVRAMLEGTISRDELGLAIVRATRVFARRQRTWLNHADVAWLS